MTLLTVATPQHQEWFWRLHDLQRINHVYNKRDVLLDLVLSSKKSFLVSLENDFLLPVEERHHPPLALICHVTPSLKKLTVNNIYTTSKGATYRILTGLFLI